MGDIQALRNVVTNACGVPKAEFKAHLRAYDKNNTTVLTTKENTTVGCDTDRGARRIIMIDNRGRMSAEDYEGLKRIKLNVNPKNGSVAPAELGMDTRG